MDFHQDYSSHRQYKLSMILNVMDELFAVNLKLYRDTTMYDRRHLFQLFICGIAHQNLETNMVFWTFQYTFLQAYMWIDVSGVSFKILPTCVNLTVENFQTPVNLTQFWFKCQKLFLQLTNAGLSYSRYMFLLVFGLSEIHSLLFRRIHRL